MQYCGWRKLVRSADFCFVERRFEYSFELYSEAINQWISGQLDKQSDEYKKSLSMLFSRRANACLFGYIGVDCETNSKLKNVIDLHDQLKSDLELALQIDPQNYWALAISAEHYSEQDNYEMVGHVANLATLVEIQLDKDEKHTEIPIESKDFVFWDEYLSLGDSFFVEGLFAAAEMRMRLQ
mmetsp:Transcript_5154/g.9009  ORF Transcript_5154/g.9009 Transcript_5154/m.9009 type:complete len:182 (-) Transcript_5154:203-748(-)